jgi:hypothetical protein
VRTVCEDSLRIVCDGSLKILCEDTLRRHSTTTASQHHIMALLKRIFGFSTNTFDTSHRFETSWLISPWALFFIRALFVRPPIPSHHTANLPQSLYIFLVLIISLILTGIHPSNGGPSASSLSFSYFTILTYWGLAFYFLFASLHTLTYARTGTPLQTTIPPPHQALHSLLHTTITTYPILVTAIFWGILFRSWWTQSFPQWSNISEHALNSLFALFEIIVPRTRPAPWIHALWIVVILALYLGLAYLTHATRGIYVYGFLDPAEGGGKLAGYIVGIAAAGVVIFALRQGLVWGRRWVTETKMGREGRFYAEREREQGDVEVVVVRPWEK